MVLLKYDAEHVVKYNSLMIISDYNLVGKDKLEHYDKLCFKTLTRLERETC